MSATVHTIGFKDRLIASVAGYVLPMIASLYMSTVRLHLYNDQIIDRLRKKYGGFLCVFWHNRMLPLIWAKRHQKVVAMVSPSGDGEIVARVLERLGYRTIRSSTNKRPVAGAKSVLSLLKNGHIVALIPDGPRGPIYTVSPGAVAIAKLSGKPVLPASCVFSDCWRLNSWDRFMIPKPFTKVLVGFGSPLLIEKEEPLNTARERLKKALNDLESRLLEELKRV